MSTFYVFCKDCKTRFNEALLHDGRCPLCGLQIGLPDSLNIKTGKVFDLKVTFTDISGNTVIKVMNDVPEAYYNHMRYVNKNVQWLEVLAEKRN